MKAKTKKFSYKLLALFMAILMAASCLSAAFSAYAGAASYSTKYHDSDVEYNKLGWSVLSDEQVATAALDLADRYLVKLKAYEEVGAKAIASADIPVVSLNWDLSKRQITAKAIGISLATVTVKLGSIDEIIETLESVQSLLDGGIVGTLETFNVSLGVIGELDFSSVKGMRRNKTSSTDIIKGFLGIIYNNNDRLIGSLLRGNLDLGILGGMVDVYGLLAGFVGADNDETFKGNLVYEAVKSLLFTKTEWFSDEEIAAYKADPSTFVYDEVLLEKMTTELLDKIAILVTYGQEYKDENGNTVKADTSATRYLEIKEYMDANSATYSAAAAALGYDPNLVYSSEDRYKDEDGNPTHILLFAYGSPDANGYATENTDMIALDSDDSLFAFGYQGLKMAWNTVLKGSVKLLHVNYDVDRGHGSNFDNVYYYYFDEKGEWTGDPTVDYSQENIQEFANAKYQEYGASSAEEFLEFVRNNYTFDRGIEEDATGTWRDIDETTLFNKVRYSPLADYGFNMQTGPINLYFMQLGTANLDEFFENYSDYPSLVAGLNDGLVAAVKDLFPNRANIYKTQAGDLDVPQLATYNTESATIGETEVRAITNTLVSNALKVVQYTADATDLNILNGFYTAGGTTLSESNLESAMIPLLIACLGQVNVSGYKLEDMIHPEDWDKCADAEAVAFVALREYLSYILPNKNYDSLVSHASRTDSAPFAVTLGSVTANGGYTNGAILAMARDAIMYVIQPYVPVTDSSGNSYDVESTTINTTADIFQLLNSVVCYYADKYTDWSTSTRSTNGEVAMGVAPLFGICDSNGASLVNTGNSLWTNIDVIINKILPVVGELQGYGSGQADSFKLIWNDVVKGVLNIADTNSETNLCGVSNFLYRVLTIVSASPIQTTPIVRTVYDVLKDLVNAVFGARYSGQTAANIIPDASTAHPFDDLLQKAVIAGTGSSNMGVVCNLLANLIEFTGFGKTNNTTKFPDTLIPGVTFGVSAANSIWNFFSDIGDHKLNMGSVAFNNPVVTGCSSNKAYSETAVFTNNAVGVNTTYLDGMNNNAVNQMSRYYMSITNAAISGPSDCSVTQPASTLIAPGGTMDITTSVKYANATNDLATYTLTVTYSITDASGNVIVDANGTRFANLKTYAVIVLTGAVDWADVVYPSERWGDTEDFNGVKWSGNMLAEALESTSASQTKTLNGYRAFSTAKFGNNNNVELIANYPEYIVLSTDNLHAADHYGTRIYNTTGFAFGNAEKACDGFYYYNTDTIVNSATGSNFTASSSNPIAVVNKMTGDLVKKGLYDYSEDGGTTWNTNSGNGWTKDEADTAYSNTADTSLFEYRDHVVYTFAEAQAANIIAAYHVNELGQYDIVYLQAGNVGFDDLLLQISVRGPIDGFYQNPNKVTVAKGKSAYFDLIKYDGQTEIPYTNITAHAAYYRGDGTKTVDIKFVVCDTSNASNVSDKVSELQEVINKYQAADFVSGQTTIDTANSIIAKGLEATALPITPTTAANLSDTTAKQFITMTSTSTTGDKAYTPLTTAQYNALTDAVKEKLYSDGTIYYFDAEHKQPVYSTTPLTAAGVTNGKDAAGIDVTGVTNDDNVTTYYITNTAQDETEWVDSGIYATYPCRISTGNQATNDNDELLYDQIQWIYFNKSGNQVSSTSQWVIKVPEASFQLVKCTASVDNRGIYTQTSDLFDYTIDGIYDDLSGTANASLLNSISLVRNNMSESDYEITSYNKMVTFAKSVENQYQIELTFVGEDDKTYTHTINFDQYNDYVNNDKITIDMNSITVKTTLSSVQIREYVRLFNYYMSKVVERGYIGNQLEAEITDASNNAYDKYTVTTAAVFDDSTKSFTSNGEISSNGATNDPAFGAFNAQGKLVNEGPVKYDATLWQNYVNALSAAVAIAQSGNGSYEHKAKAYYDAADKDDYTAQVTDAYIADTALQVAEIALEDTDVLTIGQFEGGSVTVNGAAYTAPVAVTHGEYATIAATASEGYELAGFTVGNDPTVVAADENGAYAVKMKRATTVTPVFTATAAATLNVTGTLLVALDKAGTTANKGVVGDYTVTITDGNNNEVASDVFAMTASSSDFTFDLEPGTYTATIESNYAIPRTVEFTVDDADISATIAMITCDFDSDGGIGTNDAIQSLKSTGAAYMDVDGDGSVGTADAILVLKMGGATYATFPAVSFE